MSSKISHLYVAFLTAAFLLIAPFVSAKNLQAQDKPDQPPIRIIEPLTPGQPLNQNEINKMRDRLGSSVGKQLRDILPGVDPEQLYNESLRGLISQQEPSKQIPAVESLTLPVKTVFGSAKKDNASGIGSTQAVLRTAAKKLENLAAELEQVKFYGKADQLRKTATSYWLEARSLD